MSQQDDKKVIVKENCIGCWACIAVCGDIFALNDEWKAFVKEWVKYDNIDCIDDAVWVCPVEAIEKN